MNYAPLVAIMADPVVMLIGALAIVAGIGAAWIYLFAHAADDAPRPHAIARVDMAMVNQQSRQLLQRAWDRMSPVRQPLVVIGPNARVCAPACSARACDTNPRHCARLRADGKVVIFQRLSEDERAAIRIGAQAAALQDHALGAPKRATPMPRHTRAAAIFAIEYEHQRHVLELIERAA